MRAENRLERLMKHLGNITKINGADAPIVDIICGGSPCQDLSVAGKRAGLDGERSGLFMEQVRIVKEQRNECIRQLQLRGADVDLRLVKPRYMVWENVPGAFSSNKGEDFRCVLEEICRIADKTADVPLPEKGKWSNSGCIVGDGWSVAWQVHDSQFWGVPQRRKRIALVADFGSESAAEILFEREGVSGDINPCGEKREEIAGTIKDSTNKAISFQERAGCPGGGKGILIQDEKTASLTTQQNQSVCYGIEPDVVCYRGDSITSPINASNPQPGDPCHTLTDDSRNYVVDSVKCYGMDNERRRGPEEHEDQSPTITAKVHGVAYGVDCYNQSQTEETCKALTNKATDSDHIPCVYGVTTKGECWDGTQTAPTLTANNADGSQRMPDKENFNAVITYGLDRASFNQGKNALYDFSVEEEKAQTLVAKGPGGVLTTQ
jgi:site-specific DNA-cytosine methylase